MARSPVPAGRQKDPQWPSVTHGSKLDARIELDRSHHAYLETEVAQGGA